ncbi:MAG TPA: PQQ-dependent sugar dehydrogenase [Chthoniobacteraceae bacterium]|nr:PQQ-dependent sugar dehydrogenase [Chthoniobacteraceae bacterium]
MKTALFSAFSLLLGSAVFAQDASRFEKEVLVQPCSDPLQLDLAADGRVFFIERKGAVKMWEPASRRTVTLGDFPAATAADAGALGLTLARDFEKSGHLYTIRVPAQGPARLVLARHTLTGEKLNDERTVLTIPLSSGREQSHCGAGLAWDAQGNLLVSVGDNMPPQDVPAIHSEDASRDARGTAGNSQELRGKILRITPKPDASYGIPAGNLFTDAAQGRPEVFAFGVRNPFRVTCDAKTGLIFWGDVGGNVRTDLQLGPEGFDELNVTRGPGFFGWPFCSGPNAPWRPFDPRTLKPAGDFFDPAKIINDSRANTGLRELPPARPAVFYYNTMASQEWPFVGSGGRSITGGVVYRKPATAGESRLPDEWEGAYLFGEWMRNWVAAARFDDTGKLTHIERVLAGLTFKRPADFKIGPDGALYLAECGDRWTGNTESQITRVIYRRGNRPPIATLSASRTAGKLPLEVAFDAAGSRDADGDELKFAWDFGDGKKAEGVKAAHAFSNAGVWLVTLTVTDAKGASAAAATNIAAGNEAPRVKFAAPHDGGFLDGNEVAWSVSADDAEDGPVPAERLLIQLEKRDRAVADDTHPGLALMKRTTCFACHNATEHSAGPPYTSVAARYAADSGAREKLAAKIISGGAGVWGQLPMPPHPQHTPADTALMVDWVLSLAQRKITTLPATAEGNAPVPPNAGGFGLADNTVVFLTASTIDKGAGSLSPQRGSSEVMLRARRQRAACFDHSENAAAQDNIDQGGLVARIEPGGWIAFDRVRVQDFARLRLSGWPQGNAPLKVRILAGDKELSQQDLPPVPSTTRQPKEFLFSTPPADADTSPQQLRVKLDGPLGSVLDVMWLEFQR